MPLPRRSTLLGAFTTLLPLPTSAAPLTPILQYESETGGHIGFHARNIRTGATLSWRADERFVMCSTFKASLAALVLHHVDHGTDHLTDLIPFTRADIPDWHAPAAKANLARGAMSVGEMCQAAVSQSDNTCATLLLSRVGGRPP